jgi:hypothetical protein
VDKFSGGINSLEIDLFLFDARGVHDNFCRSVVIKNI